MALVGFATIIAAVRRHSAPGMSTEALFALDVLQLTVFAILISWAVAVRTDGASHNRLMILATVALLGPALSRWPCDFVFSSDLAFFGTLDSFLIFMIAFDLYAASANGSLVPSRIGTAAEKPNTRGEEPKKIYTRAPPTASGELSPS
jgi:hypothetical protein